MVMARGGISFICSIVWNLIVWCYLKGILLEGTQLTVLMKKTTRNYLENTPRLVLHNRLLRPQNKNKSLKLTAEKFIWTS